MEKVKLDEATDENHKDVNKQTFPLPTRYTFTVLPPEKYNQKFPSFREPSEIGFFSLGPERNFIPSDKQLKYIIMPNTVSRLNFNLNHGYSSVIKKDFSKLERIDYILRWILNNREKVMLTFGKRSELSFNADFVCYRGLLTAVLCTVYENKEDWLICATKFQNTIYLCGFYTEQQKDRMKNATSREQLMSSWGYKFEQYMTADSKNGKPDINLPVNEKEEFNILVKGRLNQYYLLYGAEVDGVDASVNCPDGCTKRYVELKTSRIITSERQDWNFCRFKLTKWWAQSFLIGIPKIICGFRDDQGIVHNVRTLRTSELPKMAEGLWSPAAMMNFAASFLDFVKEHVVKDDPYTVYKFYWKPGQNIECTELSSPSEYQILPDWYISAFTKNAAM